jgi:hypothetical protein
VAIAAVTILSKEISVTRDSVLRSLLWLLALCVNQDGVLSRKLGSVVSESC